jgi:hypothetical protein
LDAIAVPVGGDQGTQFRDFLSHSDDVGVVRRVFLAHLQDLTHKREDPLARRHYGPVSLDGVKKLLHVRDHTGLRIGRRLFHLHCDDVRLLG